MDDRDIEWWVLAHAGAWGVDSTTCDPLTRQWLEGGARESLDYMQGITDCTIAGWFVRYPTPESMLEPDKGVSNEQGHDA